MKITRTKYDTLIATLLIFFTICFLISLFSQNSNDENSPTTNILSEKTYTIVYYTLDSLPEYSDNMKHPYVYINNNEADFSDILDTIDLTQPFESYSELDRLGRCGTAIANICKSQMPATNEKDTKSSKITPSGWPSGDNNSTSKITYNRCHLIAHSLTNESGNKQNLITGTRYMNVSGMYPFEYQVKKYIDKHYKDEDTPCVLYRVTPIFKDDNLIASGVHMEAMSHGTNGEQLNFNVFVYNVQKGVTINYQTGGTID